MILLWFYQRNGNLPLPQWKYFDYTVITIFGDDEVRIKGNFPEKDDRIFIIGINPDMDQLGWDKEDDENFVVICCMNNKIESTKPTFAQK